VQPAVADIASHDPPETTGAELGSDGELDSEDDPEEVGVSVGCGVSVEVVVCSVVAVWVSGVPAACVAVDAAAAGTFAGDLRAFTGVDLCVV
jgi:hypothetical protein